jgi:lysozyme
MGQMFVLLLRILFPLDKVARSRELMRGWLQMVMGWVADPEDVEGFAYWTDDRAKLEGHVCALEYAMQGLIHERARDLLGLPFIYFPRQRNPIIRHPKSMSQLFKRLTQLARDFHNLDTLAERRADRIKRERDSNPLRLAATPQSTSPALRAVEANHRPLASTSATHWGRWIARSCAQDGGGGAFARGPPSHQSIAYCQLPIASRASARDRSRAPTAASPFTPRTAMLVSRQDSTRGRRAVNRLLAAIAALCALTGAACSRSEATTAAIPANAVALAQPLVPDSEADAIPTANGIPLVPLTAEVNFLDALEPQASYKLPSEYNTNHTAVQIIKEEETLQLEAYELGGLWLIGYGHLMLEGEDDVITEEQADAFLVEDLHWCEGSIERYVTIPVTLNEFSAMVAFCYNVGSGKTRGSSIVKRINDEDRPGAANAFLLWNRMNGVVMQALAKRRARERTLFLTP